MAEPVAALLGDGTTALAEGDWVTAERCFRELLDREPSGAAHRGLGEALWWQGQIAAAIAQRERSVAAFAREQRYPAAAGIALRLAVDYHSNVGNRSASAGWLARARTLVDEHDVAVLSGWVDMVAAFTASVPRESEHLARAAVGRAREVGDTDLELQALSVLGGALIAQARIDEGTACLDEAMAGSLGGQHGDPGTVVFTSCNMIKACTSCADVERVIEWVLAADRFRETFGCAFLYATCRAQYGRVLTLIGDWERADQELTAAVAAAAGSLPAIHADATSALASLRVFQGRYEDARRLIAGSEWHPDAAAVAAALHLVEGDLPAAERVLEAAWAPLDPGALASGPLREQLGLLSLERGDVSSASDHAQALTGVAAVTSCQLLEARGDRLAGLVAGASGDLEAARQHLDAASAIFDRLGCVHEAARSRAAVATVLEEARPDLAAAAARAAHAVFDGLGAAPEADAMAALLRRLGERVTTHRAGGGDLLTAREREVLGLVAEGLSNPDIAERLFLSRRTVEHHVASILRKLGVRSRTEAAVHPAATGP